MVFDTDDETPVCPACRTEHIEADAGVFNTIAFRCSNCGVTFDRNGVYVIP